MAALLSDKLVWFDAGRPGTDPTRFKNLGTGGSAYDALIGGVVLNPLTMAYFNAAVGGVSQPGLASNYASSPDRNQFDITGDIEIIVHAALADWTPTVGILVSKYGGAANRSYQFFIDTSGRPALTVSADGTNPLANLSTVPLGFTDGTAHWIKVTLDVDDGAGNRVATFYTSTDGITWTFHDSVTTAAVATIFISTNELSIGAYVSSGVYTTGTFYRAMVKNGIGGTVVADFNPDRDAVWPYQHWVSSASGEGWTVNSASIYTTGRPKRIRHTGKNHMWTPGLSNNAATTPDSAALSITGDVELQWFGAPDVIANNGSFLSKWGAAPNRSYALYILSTNLLTFSWSENGTASTVVSSTVPWTQLGHTEQDVGFKVTFDVDDGAGNNVVTFYVSVNDGQTWAQLGAPVTTAGATSIFDSNATVIVGFNGNLSSGAGDTGKHYRAVIKNGIAGTVVFDVDFTKLTAATQTTITEQSSNAATVTIARNTTGRKTAVVVRDIVNFGTDDFWELSPDPLGAYVRLDAAGSDYIATPDSAALDIVGDLDIRVKLALDDWASGTGMTIVTKSGSVPQRAYAFGISATGFPNLVWSADGTAIITKTSTAAVPVADGVEIWLRVTLDVDNGAVGNDVTFYTSTDGVTWTQLGTTVTTAATTSVNASTNALDIGRQSGIFSLTGKVFSVEIRDGIAGTVAARFDAYGLASGGTSYTSQTTGEVWTVNGGPTVTNPNPLNLATTSNLSVLVSARQWATVGTEALVAKRDGAGAAGDTGWALYAAAGPLTDFAVDDGTNRPLDTQTSANGVLELKAGVRDVTADTAGAMVDGVGVGVSDTTTAAAMNGLGIRVGRLAGAGTSYATMELHAAVIDPSVISNADQVTLAAAIAAMGTQTAEDLRTRYHGGRLLSTTAA